MPDNFPIDVVLTWVDGDDPAHRARRARFVRGDETAHDDIAGETRFRQVGEIAFCVASVLRFVPFVRKIFIVTDNQNPHLDGFIGAHFPDNRTPVEIVDHTVIFRGYEQYLPVFNSLAIETMLWRIPELSEHYIYMNDDLAVISPTVSTDYFTPEGCPVAYAYWHSTFTARLLRALRRREGSHREFRFRDSMLNATDYLGDRRRFLRINHTPHMMRRSFFERFYAEHPEAMERNIRHRFRDEEQFNPQALAYAALALRGECRVEPSRCKYIYMQPDAEGRFPSEEALRAMNAQSEALFCCLNSLDKAPDEDRRRITAWLGKRLGIHVLEQ